MNIGDSVRVSTGPFKGQTVTIEKIEGDQVTCGVLIFGSKREVTMQVQSFGQNGSVVVPPTPKRKKKKRGPMQSFHAQGKRKKVEVKPPPPPPELPDRDTDYDEEPKAPKPPEPDAPAIHPWSKQWQKLYRNGRITFTVPQNYYDYDIYVHTTAVWIRGFWDSKEARKAGLDIKKHSGFRCFLLRAPVLVVDRNVIGAANAILKEDDNRIDKDVKTRVYMDEDTGEESEREPHVVYASRREARESYLPKTYTAKPLCRSADDPMRDELYHRFRMERLVPVSCEMQPIPELGVVGNEPRIESRYVFTPLIPAGVPIRIYAFGAFPEAIGAVKARMAT